jgi:hypothetical protein
MQVLGPVEQLTLLAKSFAVLQWVKVMICRHCAFFSLVASFMSLLRFIVYAAWTALGLAKSWFCLRTDALHQWAVTEGNCLGFENFWKRTNEIRGADAGVCTRFKIMTLWKVLLLREIYSNVMGSYPKIFISKLSPSVTSANKRFRSWAVGIVNFVSGLLMNTYKSYYTFLLPNLRADTNFEISQTPKLKNSTKSMWRKCVMTVNVPVPKLKFFL